MPRKGTKLSPDAAKKQSAAIAAWHEEKIENLSIGLRKGKREAYKKLAAARGTSVSKMIQTYMDSEYEKEFGCAPILKEEKTMKPINRYSYEDLLAAAIAPAAEQDDINALGEWFESFGQQYWNGECFDADGRCLYRIESWDPEAEQGTVTGYEFH